VYEERDRYRRARALEVLVGSPGRVAPPCPFVALGCGGCGWQHVEPGLQRRLKVGMVSEADLLVKELAQGSGAHLPWFEGSHAQDIRRRREAVTAQGLMSAPVISVHPDTTVRQAAKTMCEKRIKRLPVVTGGWLVGIISRADVLRIYLLPDEQLRRHAERILQWAFGPAADHLAVAVQEGVVIITGEVETRCEAELASRLLGRMEGVVGVDTRVDWRVDDPPDTPSWR
jgi:hypothetical protein